MSADNFVLAQWNRLSGYPGGKWLFSKVVANKAPYFNTIGPLIEELRPGYAKVSIRKRRAVQNHIGTVHAIALCNLMEICMGVCAEASIPKHLRWLPKGMTVRYTAKAGSDITGYAEVAAEAWKPGDVDVKVWATDAAGKTVIEGTITLWVTEKKAA
ncbi:MAG: hotdog fold domain-containing protein [Pseudomonadota bacterium]